MLLLWAEESSRLVTHCQPRVHIEKLDGQLMRHVVARN